MIGSLFRSSLSRFALTLITHHSHFFFFFRFLFLSLVFPSCLGVDDVRHAFREALAEIERVDEMKKAASAAGKARRKKRARIEARERERENFRHRSLKFSKPFSSQDQF